MVSDFGQNQSVIRAWTEGRLRAEHRHPDCGKKLMYSCEKDTGLEFVVIHYH